MPIFAKNANFEVFFAKRRFSQKTPIFAKTPKIVKIVKKVFRKIRFLQIAKIMKKVFREIRFLQVGS
jgi:hypothetical protein